MRCPPLARSVDENVLQGKLLIKNFTYTKFSVSKISKNLLIKTLYQCYTAIPHSQANI